MIAASSRSFMSLHISQVTSDKSYIQRGQPV